MRFVPNRCRLQAGTANHAARLIHIKLRIDPGKKLS
jgi:hypothetical protein